MLISLYTRIVASLALHRISPAQWSRPGPKSLTLAKSARSDTLQALIGERRCERCELRQIPRAAIRLRFAVR
jgi:hypothetical protein